MHIISQHAWVIGFPFNLNLKYFGHHDREGGPIQPYMFWDSCFRFNLSLPIDINQVAVQREHARLSMSPSNGQRVQTFPKASWQYRELGFLEYLDRDIRQTKQGKVYTNPFHQMTAHRKERGHSLETVDPVQLSGHPVQHLGFMTI